MNAAISNAHRIVCRNLVAGMAAMLCLVVFIGCQPAKQPSKTPENSATPEKPADEVKVMEEDTSQPTTPETQGSETAAPEATAQPTPEPAPKPESTPEPEAKPEPTPEPEAKPEPTPEPAPDSTLETKPTPEPQPEPEPAAKAAAESAPAAEPASNAVTLGTPELTAGIPGEGTLSIEEITTWLDDPANHVELSVSLPMGLAEGESQMKGLDANPLTRAKIELGRQLYFDTRLSADNTISCASCHAPDHAFGRETQFGVGIKDQKGTRNSPVAYNRILSDKQFWDGRAESLEAQAVGPIENPIEMGNTHDAVVEMLKGDEGYRMQFEKIFGDVTIDNVAKAIASFERCLVTGPTPYDYQKRLAPYDNVNPDDLKADDPDLYAEYQQVVADAAAHPMSDSAKRGMAIFFSDRGGCSACHVGANLTDERYHNLGVGMDAEKPDLGRFVVTKDDKDTGAFKTPTIRNVAQSAPYMHDGSQKTLAEVVEWYVKGGHPNDHLDKNVKKLDLDDQAKQDLIAFLEACTGEFPPVQTGRLPE